MSTRDKIAFAHFLGKHSRATVSDCLRLLRYAYSFQQLRETRIAKGSYTGEQANKLSRIKAKITAICDSAEIRVSFGIYILLFVHTPGDADKPMSIEVPV